MLLTLIQKDLARLRVNWRGLVILLAMPFCITALVGTAFGPAARSGDFPRIKLAIVDEDQNAVGNMLAGAAVSEQSREYLDAIVTDRDEAMQLIRNNKVSAVIVVPPEFTERYLSGKAAPPIEVVKNPAQSYMPAITEELMRVVTELLSAVSLNLLSEMPELMEILEDEGAPDVAKLTKVVSHVGTRFERAEAYLFPPIISVKGSTVEENADKEDVDSKAAPRPAFNMFAFVMPGLIALFMLFTAEGAARELFTEKRSRTLDRYRTLNVQLLPFLVAKSAYATVVVIIAALIMMIGGWLAFGITWNQPLALACLTFCYSIFCVGFAFLLIAIVFQEKVAGMLNTVLLMLIGFLGGSMMPSQNLPSFIRDLISPWMPNYVFAESLKRLQLGFDGPHWATASIELVAVGIAMLWVATIVVQRRLAVGAL